MRTTSHSHTQLTMAIAQFAIHLAEHNNSPLKLFLKQLYKFFMTHRVIHYTGYNTYLAIIHKHLHRAKLLSSKPSPSPRTPSHSTRKIFSENSESKNSQEIPKISPNPMAHSYVQTLRGDGNCNPSFIIRTNKEVILP